MLITDTRLCKLALLLPKRSLTRLIKGAEAIAADKTLDKATRLWFRKEAALYKKALKGK